MARAKERAFHAVLHASGLLVGAALVYVVLRHIGLGQVIAAMRKARPRSLLQAAMLYFTVFWLWAFRWQLLIPRPRRRSFALIFPIYMAGVFGNTVTPGARVGGELLRAYYMSRAFGGEKTAYLGTVLVDKLGNNGVFFVFFLAAVTFVVLYVPLALPAKIILEGAVLLVVAAVVSGFLLREQIGTRSPLIHRLLVGVYNSSLLSFLRRRFPTFRTFEEYTIHKLENIFGPVAHAAVSPKALAKIVMISGTSYMLFYLAHYELFRGMGVNLSFTKVAVIVTIATFCGDMSVSPGGAGFMEAAMIGLCAAFGLDYGTAVAVTLVSRGLYYFYGLGLGGASLVGLTIAYGRRRPDAADLEAASSAPNPPRPPSAPPGRRL